MYFDEAACKKSLAQLRVKGQTRRHSLFESISNVVVGFVISVGANWIVLPWFGYNVNMLDSAGIGLVFTVVSVIRSYVLRRVYNQIYLRGS